MSSVETFHERIAAVSATPPELTAYREWLAAQDTTGPRDYLFTEKRSRFEPRREDVVVTLDGLSVIEAKGRTVVRCADQAITIPVPDVSAADTRRILELVDGERCLLEVQLDAELPPIVLALMLRATFGRVILAPEAVNALEAQISGLEIARFPGPPYQLMRPYWRNMAAVRARIGEAPPEAFTRWLRELHVIALMGDALDSFYKPASPGADTLVAPGALFCDAVNVRETGKTPLFLSGPRVNAKLIGGDAYHAALYRSVGDLEAVSRSEPLAADGETWGRVVVARSERDPEPLPWFCPPRPMRDGHFVALRRHLAEALAGGEGVVAAAARFHWCFVRLHPFHCGNQSLAMNLVNAALGRAVGAGIPHLVLDHFALRLTLNAYVDVFTRAVRAYAIEGDAAERVSRLMAANTKSYAFIAKLTGDADVEALIRDDPEGARYALVG